VETLSAELNLLVAMLRQLFTDAVSGNAAVREEARSFVSDDKKVQYWDNCLALDGQLLRQARALLESRKP
jgi:hypothetical protein